MTLDQEIITLIKNKDDICMRLWEPQETIIVLGRSNRAEKEVYVNKAREDGVKIFRRIGGGGAVVLSSGMLVISVAKYVQDYFEARKYFDLINDLIISSLGDFGVKPLEKMGISDVCIDDKKILGSSMYRNRNMLFYQASLLINPDLSKVAYYLKHPTKEPDYRCGREHEEFITSLVKEGHDISCQKARNKIEVKLNANIWSIN